MTRSVYIFLQLNLNNVMLCNKLFLSQVIRLMLIITATTFINLGILQKVDR